MRNSKDLEKGVVRLGGDVQIDVAIRMGENTYDSLDKEKVLFCGEEISVITLRQLYEMKENSYREKDQEDIVAITKYVEERRKNE